MTRLRFDNISSFGTTNPITLATTSASVATFSSAPAFPTIAAPDYAVISVQPSTANEEIIYVTNFVSGSTSASVTRAQEGTSAVAVTGAVWVHGPTVSDFQGPLVPTTVMTAAYVAEVNDFAKFNLSGGSVGNQLLPNAPADKSLFGAKIVAMANANTLVLSCQGNDVINISGGATSYTLKLLDQSVTMQYQSSASIWNILADDLPLGQLDARYTGYPTLLETGTQYVTTTGKDTNDGLTWATGKATIQAAINTLPLAADSLSRNGVVEVGYGQFLVQSALRQTGSVTLTNGSTVVSDASAVTGDVGGYPIFVGGGDHLPQGTLNVITSASAGVGWTMSANATGTMTISGGISIVHPAIVGSPGVIIRGRGRSNGFRSGQSTNYPTEIYDTGTGFTILAPSGGSAAGTAPDLPTQIGGSTQRFVMEDICVIGNGTTTTAATNVFGLYAANLWGLTLRSCTFNFHGVYGIYLDNNLTIVLLEDVDCYWNGGTASQTQNSGGMFMSQTPNLNICINSRFIDNWGFGCNVVGAHFYNCDISYNYTTQYSSSGAFSGTGCYVNQGSATDGITSFDGCWFESNALYGCTPTGTVTFSGCEFNLSNYGIYFGSAFITLQGCLFQDNIDASIHTTSTSSDVVINWDSCQSIDPEFITSNASGQHPTIPVALAQSRGAWANGSGPGTIVTSPQAETSVALTSGTPWQNTTGSDVLLSIPMSFTVATDTVGVMRGAASPPALLGTITGGASTTAVPEYYVPALWYFGASLGGSATFAASATAQPV